jgi:hypothetical protein
MTATPDPPDPTSRRRALLVLPLALLFASWLMVQSYTPYASRACYAQYQAAKTQADSAAVDSRKLHLPSDQSHEGFSCGAIRAHARWW